MQNQRLLEESRREEQSSRAERESCFYFMPGDVIRGHVIKSAGVALPCLPSFSHSASIILLHQVDPATGGEAN